MRKFFKIIFVFWATKIAKWNYNYERIKEPRRFLIGMTVGIGPLILLDMIAVLADNSGATLLGLLWVFSFIGIRIWWLSGNLKKWLPSDHKPYNKIKV
jgi:hypothetical protein